MSRLPLLLAAAFLCTALLVTTMASAAEPMFTTYNMWYEVPNRMWTINYKRGNILPAGTEVKDIAVFKTESFPQQYITFRRATDNQLFKVSFIRKFHPGKKIGDYRQLMFSQHNFNEQTANFSEREINAITRGVLVTGMSKPAVVMAYGVPPQHKTPTMEANVWRYWTSRMVSKNICFGVDGTTVHCYDEETL
jgi:hypothetical protein